MGAYGGTIEASKSYFGAAPCETIVAGDVNGDCRINFSDFAILASHWLQWTPAPGCHGLAVTDVKIYRYELVEGWIVQQEEVQKVTVGDYFSILVEVENFGCTTQYLSNLYGWDFSPENSVEVIGDSITCAAYYELAQGDVGWLLPFCPHLAFSAKESGWVTMGIRVVDWYNSVLCEHMSIFEIQ